ncbi:hypothetical protein [Xanthomonas campestris]|uniref:hypothetical protein n=1 Tax=Xanthomonas campestris TaxID=339 RepID=UPI0023E9A585|nr:hypothetical protein [Xanthomonas campestris]
MTEPTHYHQKIHRATERLAQLQARELLASRRLEMKQKRMAKREEILRRQKIADLVFMTGAQTLDDAELAQLLKSHMSSRTRTLH